MYCDFTAQNAQSASTVLGSVLGQVIDVVEKTTEKRKKAIEDAENQAGGCELRLSKILDMLAQYLSRLRRGFICIDALDEFPIKHRARLWDSLYCLVRKHPNTRLFLTGRPLITTEVEEYFPGGAYMVTIESNLDDIRTYIEKRLKEDPDTSAMDEGLRADIRRVIPESVSGMYVLTRDVGFHRLG